MNKHNMSSNLDNSPLFPNFDHSDKNSVFSDNHFFNVKISHKMGRLPWFRILLGFRYNFRLKIFEIFTMYVNGRFEAFKSFQLFVKGSRE